MIVILKNYFFFLSVILVNGIFFKKIFLNKANINLFEIFFFGILFSIIISNSINFFSPLNDIVIYLNFFLIIFLIEDLKKLIKNIKYLNKVLLIIIFVLFLNSLINIYGSYYSDDLTHYHGSYITNIDNEKIIFGLNFLNDHFGYNSSWLTLHAYFNLNKTFLQDIHILNGIVYFLICSYILYELFFSENFQYKNILSVLIFFILLKYTRLKEFGIDRPGIILFLFFFIFVLKNYKLNINTEASKQILSIFFLIALLLTTIKIFFIISFVLPIMFCLHNLIKTRKIFFFKISIIYVFSIFLFKNVITTGCLIYPIKNSCLTTVKWNNSEIINNLVLKTEASAKSYESRTSNISMERYNKNFYWLKTWKKRNQEEFTNFFITIVFISILNFIFFKFKFRSLNIIFALCISVFLSNLIFFLKVPVIRYHHILFIFSSILISTLFTHENIKRKKLLIAFISLSLIFNFSKNYKRLKDNEFKNNPLEHVKNIQWYSKPEKKTLGDLTYYRGWIGASPIGNKILTNLNYKLLFGYHIIYRD